MPTPRAMIVGDHAVANSDVKIVTHSKPPKLVGLGDHEWVKGPLIWVNSVTPVCAGQALNLSKLHTTVTKCGPNTPHG